MYFTDYSFLKHLLIGCFQKYLRRSFLRKTTRLVPIHLFFTFIKTLDKMNEKVKLGVGPVNKHRLKVNYRNN